MRDIFFFDSMLTPKIITFIYWLLLAVILIGGLSTIFTVGGIGGFLSGLLTIVVGAVFARIWCELMIVIFKINDNLRKMVDRTPDEAHIVE
ncbi:MAG: DUF4282 domain-containing protein [Halothiobacillaceae bacterium]